MLNLLKETFSYYCSRKKFWLLPIFILGLVLGSILLFAQGSAVAPFIYAIF